MAHAVAGEPPARRQTGLTGADDDRVVSGVHRSSWGLASPRTLGIGGGAGIGVACPSREADRLPRLPGDRSPTVCSVDDATGTDLLERDAELAVLDAALRRAAAGSGSVVLI